jgi:hypothetical protein
MKHPVRSDFDTAVTEAGVNVTASTVFTDWLRARTLHASAPCHAMKRRVPRLLEIERVIPTKIDIVSREPMTGGVLAIVCRRAHAAPYARISCRRSVFVP